MAKLINLNCANCGTPLFYELMDTEWTHGAYYDEVEGRCPQCGRIYRWVEMFEFSHVENFHEVKKDE